MTSKPTSYGGHSPVPARTYHGSCHCGRIRFEIEADIDHVRACDCSVCRRRGALMHRIPRERLRLVGPWDALSEYRWGSGTAVDYFCPTCGILPFRRPGDPTPQELREGFERFDGWAVNVRCLEDLDIDTIPVQVIRGSRLVPLPGAASAAMHYTLRPATLADLEPMMAIGHEGIRPHVEAIRGWDELEEERGFRRHFTPDSISIVMVDGRPVGYLKVEVRRDHLYLDGIYLKASHRGRGLGARLVSDLMERSGAEGKSLRLRVLRTNPARRLYERLGFRVTGSDGEHFYMEAVSGR